MNGVTVLLDGIAEHGRVLLCGVSVVLAISVAVVVCCRSPAMRRSAALWGLAASAMYLLAAVLPLPRWQAQWPAAAVTPVLPRSEVASSADPANQPAPRWNPESGTPAEIAAAPELTASTAPVAKSSAVLLTEPPPWRWGRLLAAIWLLSASWLALYGLIGWLRLQWLLRRAEPAPQALAALVSSGRLLLLDRAIRPFAAGVFRPVVVLPRSLLANQPDLADVLLRHEAAHLQHRDPLLQSLLACLAVVLGCHPLFWWLRREVRFQSERLADEVAATVDRAAYARHLLSFAERPSPELAAPGAVSVFRRPSELYRRIQMLLQHDRVYSSPTRRQTSVMACLALLLAVGSALTLGVPLAAQQPAASPAQDPEPTAADLRALTEEVKRLQGLLAAATAAGHLREYTVQRGDTLPKIAATALGHADLAPQIQAANPGIDPQRLKIGQKLLLPPAERQQRVFLPGADGLPTTSVPVALTMPSAAGATPSASPAGATAAAAAELVSRYIDLVTEREPAAQQARNLKVLFEAGRAQAGEAQLAQARHEGIEKKILVVRLLLEGEIEATMSELRWLESQLRDADKVGKMRVDIEIQRAKARMQVLRSVL